MMRRVLLLWIPLACLLVGCGDAQATLTLNDQQAQRWADAAVVPLPEGTRTVVHEGQDMPDCRATVLVAGCTDSTSTIWLATGCGGGCRFVFFHELGHNFDAQMPEWKRVVFKQIVRMPQGWTEPDDFGDTPAEQFADAYSQCAMNRRMYKWSFGKDTYYFWNPLGPKQFARVCKLIRQENE